MIPLDQIMPGFFTLWDLCALVVFGACWFGMTWLIERPRKDRLSTAQIMARYRMRWMDAMLTRDPRIIDGNLLAQLRTGAAFFASGCMIAIGGAAALLGEVDRIVTVARDLSQHLEVTRIGSEMKTLFLILLLSSAFLKFVWSHRLFGYCAILIGAVGNDGADSENIAIARKAGQLNVSAGRSFNRGLRQVYFTLAALAWFLGPVPFLVATITSAAILYRREFRSDSRLALLRED
ncbi:MAG: putative membrane protein [Paracoccaceae bacterium]|jgi:uncharacterized membrane protein